MDTKDKKNILCLDGGGIRGIISLTILSILDSVDNNLLSHIDIISGSSIGAVIGCSLIIPNDTNTGPKYTILDVLDIFRKKMPKIFYVGWGHWFKTLGGMIGPKYSDYNMLIELENIFGDIKVNQLLRPIIIPCYDLSSDKSFVFNTEEHGDMLVRDLLRSVTAAPTYFYPNDIIINDEKKLLVDSGVVVNNTSRLCLNYIISKMDTNISYYENYIRCKDKFKILNIGTGYINKLIDKKNNYGLTGWVPYIINIIMNAEISEDIGECKKILNNNYLKFNCLIDYKYYDLDLPQYIDIYIKTATEYMNDKKLSKYKKWLNL